MGSEGTLTGKLKAYWKNYVWQSALATAAVFTVLLFLTIEQAVIVASMGATAFIVFTMPKSVTARPRNVIGGHLVGLLCGSACAFFPHPSPMHSVAAYSLAVGLSVFLMVATDTEHPPASGTALGVAVAGFSWRIAMAVATGAAILSLVHSLLRPYLKDLV